MQIEQTNLKDCFLIHNTIHGDERGYFFESFTRNKFYKETGLDINFVQDNQSKSSHGVLRGLHFQQGEYAQTKLVRVLEGKVLDVVVDIRTASPSFGQSYTVELSDDNKLQLFVPRGFAHGFIVLSETATFFYKCDNYYNKESESGIYYNDSDLAIDWKVPADKIQLSAKDKELSSFRELLKKNN